MSETQTIIIQLLDKTYPVKCPSDQVRALQEAALYLNKKLQGIFEQNKHASLEQIVMDAALNISYELLQAKQQYTETTQGTDKTIHCLQAMIDNALTQQEELA